jgi:hypothetical protein
MREISSLYAAGTPAKFRSTLLVFLAIIAVVIAAAGLAASR